MLAVLGLALSPRFKAWIGQADSKAAAGWLNVETWFDRLFGFFDGLRAQ